jgi:hypothetical protein
MPAVPRRKNIPGAPFRIGMRVKVVRGRDDTITPGRVGCVGVVVYYEYDCGCGQTYPADPMIGLRFAGGRVDEFWRDELKEIV